MRPLRVCVPASPWLAWAVLAASLLLSACGGGSGGDGGQTGPAPDPNANLQRIEPYERTASMSALLQRAGVAAPAVRLVPEPIALGPLPPDLMRSSTGSRPRQVGAARAVPQAADAEATRQHLAWQPLPSGGQAAALRVRAEGAAGLRLGLWVQRLPAGAVVRAFGVGGGGAVTAATVRATLDRHRAAGDLSEAGATYWLPVVHGDDATLQIELPPGVDPAQVQVAMPRVSHLWALPNADAALGMQARAGTLQASGACEQDAVCSPDYEAQGRSVAVLLFTDSGTSVLCSGVLLADVGRTGRPLLLTAHHCVDSAAAASTLVTYWFYRSAACNSSTLSDAAVERTGGATILHSAASPDATLLELSAATARPPAGAVHAGSLLGPPAVGTDLAGLHHPRGDLLKLSLGTLLRYAACNSSSSGVLNCSGSDVSGGDYLALGWTRGVTEGGSSGSPAFATVGGQRYVAGILAGGASSCEQPHLPDYFTRFDRVYPALRTWLGTVPGT